MKQAVWFLAVVFSITWVLCLVLREPAATGNLSMMLAWLLPTVWSPTIVAMLLTWRSEGLAGVRREFRRVSYPRGSGRWLIFAAGLPFAAVIAAVLVSRTAGQATPFTPMAALPAMIALQLVTGAVGEELGWRGFLLPRLQQRLGIITGAWAMAILWSLWHVAGMFFPGTPLQIAPPFLFLALVVFMGVFLGFLFERTSGSVLPTMIAHLSLNITFGLGGAPASSLAFWWSIVAVFGAAALVVTALATKTPGPMRQVVAAS